MKKIFVILVFALVFNSFCACNSADKEIFQELESQIDAQSNVSDANQSNNESSNIGDLQIEINTDDNTQSSDNGNLEKETDMGNAEVRNSAICI